MLNNDWVVLCPGHTLSVWDVSYVRGKARCAAVSNAVQLAPFADILVSCDAQWWHVSNPTFLGARYANAAVANCTRIEGLQAGSNSGLAAIHVCDKVYQAKRIIVLGMDLGGTHFFGDHKPPLKNTQPHRFETFKRQLQQYKCDAELIDCTIGGGSHLPKQNLRDVI